jgi:hypothetical protein
MTEKNGFSEQKLMLEGSLRDAIGRKEVIERVLGDREGE